MHSVVGGAGGVTRTGAGAARWVRVPGHRNREAKTRTLVTASHKIQRRIQHSRLHGKAPDSCTGRREHETP